MRVNNLYKLQVETNATLSRKARNSQSREVVVEREKDKALKMEPHPVSQFQSKLVGSLADYQDDGEQSTGQVELATQSKTSSIGRVQAKWVEDLVKGDQERVGSSSIAFIQRKHPQRYTRHITLITEVINSQSMVEKNKPSNQVLQRKAGKSSSLEGGNCNNRECGSVGDRSRWTRFF